MNRRRHGGHTSPFWQICNFPSKTWAKSPRTSVLRAAKKIIANRCQKPRISHRVSSPFFLELSPGLDSFRQFFGHFSKKAARIRSHFVEKGRWNFLTSFWFFQKKKPWRLLTGLQYFPVIPLLVLPSPGKSALPSYSPALAGSIAPLRGPHGFSTCFYSRIHDR